MSTPRKKRKSSFPVLLALGTLFSLGCGSSGIHTTTPVIWSINASDLRFQGVGVEAGTKPYEATFVLGGMRTTWTAYYGTPLILGQGICGSVAGDPTDCAWGYNVKTPLAGSTALNATYSSGRLESMSSDALFSSSTSIVRSIDIEPGNDAYATAVIGSSSSSGFSALTQSVLPGALQSTLSANGLNGIMPTGLSFDATGNVVLISYGWSQDKSSAYDVTAVQVDATTFASSAQTLAGEGYVITAFGGSSGRGYELIGTRLSGSSATRTIMITTGFPDASTFAQGYSVAAILETTTNPDGQWLLEK